MLDLVNHRGTLYAAAYNCLLEIDPRTAAAEVIIEYPIGETQPPFMELTSDGEQLWALTISHGSPGPVFRSIGPVDPATGLWTWSTSLDDLLYASEPLTLDVAPARQAPPLPADHPVGTAALVTLVATAGFAALRLRHA